MLNTGDSDHADVGGGRFTAGGHAVCCSTCHGEHFDPGIALVAMQQTVLGMGNAPVALLVCRQCGHIEWFVREPDAV
jgi:hypothetical protein